MVKAFLQEPLPWVILEQLALNCSTPSLGASQIECLFRSFIVIWSVELPFFRRESWQSNWTTTLWSIRTICHHFVRFFYWSGLTKRHAKRTFALFTWLVAHALVTWPFRTLSKKLSPLREREFSLVFVKKFSINVVFKWTQYFLTVPNKKLKPINISSFGNQSRHRHARWSARSRPLSR